MSEANHRDEPDQQEYCRQIEAHLCRKNEGHLIRIVGPAFERVSSWATQGIPVAVACQGIDRSVERYYRKGPRRRPLRVEFCEADVLDAFDAWRRAVGVVAAQESRGRTRSSLASHVERVIARLTGLRGSSAKTRGVDEVLERLTRELDGLQPRARQARGHAREEILSELAAYDRMLLSAVRQSLDDAAREEARRAAHEQLAPFRERMATDAYERACELAAERHIRETLGLPTLTFE